MAKGQEERRRRKQELCLSCLECCKVIAFPLPIEYSKKHVLEFYKVRGWEVVNYNRFYLAVKKEVCPQLSINGCTIYDSRPETCKAYDGRYDPIVADKCKWKELE